MSRPPLEWIRDQLTTAVSAVFTTATAANHHDPGTLSISGLGGCTRRAAYQLAGRTPSDDHSRREQRASHLGQAIHDWLLPRLADQLGAPLTLIEQDVVLRRRGLEVAGRYDLGTLAVVGGLLLDLKTHGYDQSDDGGTPSRTRLLQVYGYAAALRQTGHDVQAVAVLPMSRIHGETAGLWIGDFGPDQEALVDARVRDLQRHALAPAFAPRDGHRGPGLDMTCDSCPFASMCWPGAEPPQAMEVRTDGDVVAHSLGHAEASAQEQAWKTKKKYHATALARTRAGRYEADGFEVEVKVRPGGTRLDQFAAKGLLIDNHLSVPVTRDKDVRRVIVHRRPPT